MAIEKSYTPNGSENGNVSKEDFNQAMDAVKRDMNTSIAEAGGVSGVKVYKALLTQVGIDAPTASVLVNTLGVDISYGYSTVGQYFLSASTAVFTVEKTLIVGGSTSDDTADINSILTAMRTSDININIEAKLLNSGTGNDDTLLQASLIIEVYP